MTHMVRKMPGASLFIACCKTGFHRRLGVDDDRLVAGQVHDGTGCGRPSPVEVQWFLQVVCVFAEIR